MMPHFPRYLWNRSHNPRPLGCQLRIAWNNIMKREGWCAAGEIFYRYAGILSFPAIITNSLLEKSRWAFDNSSPSVQLKLLPLLRVCMAVPSLSNSLRHMILIRRAAGTWDPVNNTSPSRGADGADNAHTLQTFSWAEQSSWNTMSHPLCLQILPSKEDKWWVGKVSFRGFSGRDGLQCSLDLHLRACPRYRLSFSKFYFIKVKFNQMFGQIYFSVPRLMNK